MLRGAERVFAQMADMYPGAPLLTLLYDRKATEDRFAAHEVITSPLQRLGVAQSDFRRLLPLYPWAVGRLKAPPCELLLTSSSAFMHGLSAPPGAVHVCYCHAPFRYAWYERARALAEAPPLLRAPLRGLLAAVRRWDLAASRRVDRYVANSRLTQERIARFYGRESEIVYPPVDTARFEPGEPGEHLLVVSELVRHKRLDVALEAARRARAPIRVAGSGPDHEALAAAFPEAEFLGRVGDRELERLYATARAVLVPSMEEFGITAVEAQAAGRPVIAAAAGGAARDRARWRHRPAGAARRRGSLPHRGRRARRARLRSGGRAPERRALLDRGVQARAGRAGRKGPRGAEIAALSRLRRRWPSQLCT